MAPSIESDAVQAPTKANGGNGSGVKPPANATTESKLLQFLSAVQVIFPELNGENLRSLIGDYEQLKAEYEDKITAFNHNLKEFGQLRVKHDEINKALDEANADRSKLRKKLVQDRETMEKNVKQKQDLITMLKAKGAAHDEEMKRVITEIKKREEEVTKLDRSVAQKNGELGTANKEKSNLKLQLQRLTTDLEAQTQKYRQAEQQVSEINSFRVNLGDLEDERASVANTLSSVFATAVEIFRETVGLQLSPHNFEPAVWSLVKTRFRKYGIPLPASNSPDARSMRIVAALSKYSDALVQHIFTTTYLSAGNEFDNVLSALSEDDYEQDLQVRSCLLKASPDRQTIVRDERIEKVVQAVTSELTGLRPDDVAPALVERLRRLTLRIAVNWQGVQRLDERIDVQKDIELAGGRSSFRILAPVLARISEVSPSASSSLDQQRKDKQVQTTQVSEAVIQRSTDIRTVVWPAFFPADLEIPLISHGYVLTNSHAEAAAQEVSKEEESEDAQRQMRKLNRSNTAGSQKKSRRDSVSFLSQAAPAGSGAK